MLRKPKHFNEPINLYHASRVSIEPHHKHIGALEHRSNSGSSHVYGIDSCVDNNGQYHAISDIDINDFGIDGKHYLNGTMRSAMLPPIQRHDNR